MESRGRMAPREAATTVLHLALLLDINPEHPNKPFFCIFYNNFWNRNTGKGHLDQRTTLPFGPVPLTVICTPLLRLAGYEVVSNCPQGI